MSRSRTVLVRHRLGLYDELRDLAEVIDSSDPEAPWPDRAVLERVTVIVSSSQQAQPPELIAACPDLGLIHCMGAGYQIVDLAEAARRGIFVTCGGGSNAGSVADHALALLLGLLRKVPQMDRHVREQCWAAAETLGEVSERRVGLIGMGRIGRQIARRLAAFDAEVSYVARQPRAELPYAFCPSVRELADRVDTLIVACPATPETFHLVDADILRRLGPDGLVVNIGRGDVVDTAALIAALEGKAIAGAGLDVIEDEPAVPPALVGMPQVVLSPHIGGSSATARRRMKEMLLASVSAFLDGRVPPGLVGGRGA